MSSLRLALVSVLLLTFGCKKEAASSPPPTADVREEAAPADPAAPADEEESPYLDVANFNRKVEEHAGEIVACWQETAGKAPDAPTGRVKATIVVDGDGKVKKTSFDPQRSTLKHDALFACMQAKIAAWKFNITLNGSDSPMPYTFDLTSGAMLP
ncbi:AgmX/PglI C-terminal domain-containing protein [Nannocystis bainbridge]|uniref:AgmX/PglI C-terminal domain-containing protein n=1 Tax=Nannocystis bainbridge TaxID=2995303 RepID=A0ABT5E3G1_9BACT|nr:AgmX/PglI C-terminal domain-containing protein [Nannocystis bainbridge]MDC0720409.1 AgmX/PglI C-terminal domain-containing protein [Nannocystis bainbridge]